MEQVRKALLFNQQRRASRFYWCRLLQRGREGGTEVYHLWIRLGLQVVVVRGSPLGGCFCSMRWCWWWWWWGCWVATDKGLISLKRYWEGGREWGRNSIPKRFGLRTRRSLFNLRLIRCSRFFGWSSSKPLYTLHPRGGISFYWASPILNIFLLFDDAIDDAKWCK